ncbi:hypothetical protein ACIRD4_34885 [Streptomyces clavifer]
MRRRSGSAGDSPDRLTWWTNHREHRHLRRTHNHDRRDTRPGPPA